MIFNQHIFKQNNILKQNNNVIKQLIQQERILINNFLTPLCKIMKI